MGSFAPQHTVLLVKDPKGTPAVDLDTVKKAGHDDLVKYAEKAGFALSKRDLNGLRGKVVFLLDHSLSMQADFQSGAVQKLLNRALGASFQLDSDGAIPVIRFDTKVWEPVEVNQGNFASIVSTDLYKPNDMGSTDLAGALAIIKEMAATTDEPIILIVASDGNPNGYDRQTKDAPQTTKIVCELAAYPVFVKFLALREVEYLSKLDDLDNSVRLLDNVDAKPGEGSGLNLLTCSDAEFAEALFDELDTWVAAATAAGVLKV